MSHLPAQGERLIRKGGGEGVDGTGVLDVPEQLAGSAAGHVSPGVWFFRVGGCDAPSSLRHGHGNPVSAGQGRQPPVGEGQPSVLGQGSDHESEAFKGRHYLRRPPLGDAHHRRQVLLQYPGPVVDKVKGALLGGLEGDGKGVIGV